MSGENSEIAACWISRGLSERSKERAVTVLNETNERKPKALAELGQLLNAYADKHPDLAFPRRDDAFLVMFLRARKYDVEEAMKLLKGYTKYRVKHRELFEGVTYENIRSVLDLRILMPLPDRDELGRRVLLMTIAGDGLDDCTPLAMHRAMVYLLDALIMDEETQVNGLVMLGDYSGATMTRLMRYEDQKLVGQFMQLLRGAFPAQFQEMHIYNQPWFFNIAWAFAKPHMSAELKERIQVHGPDLAKLYCNIPKDTLPVEVGGDGPSYNFPDLHDFLSKVKVDRPSSSKSSS